MTSLRTLQLIDHMGSGGAQTIVRDLALGLSASGMVVEVAHLFAGNVYADELAEAGVAVHDLSTGARYRPVAALDPRPARRLSRLLARGRYDVINSHLYVAPLHLRVAGAHGARVVNTVHAHREHLPGYVYPSFRLARRVTDAFVVDFAASRSDLLQLGIAAGRIRHIPFGVDPVAPSMLGRDTARAILGLGADDVVLLSVARLHEQRHIDDFIRTVAALPASTVLLLAGDGPQEAALRALAASLGVAGRVRFLGRRSDLGELFAACDVYLSMSVGGDVGIAALQAASAGLPVVAWDIAGTTIAPCETSDRAPFAAGSGPAFASHLLALLEDPILARTMGARGQRVVNATHTAAAMTGAYAEFYERLVGGAVASTGRSIQ